MKKQYRSLKTVNAAIAELDLERKRLDDIKERLLKATAIVCQHCKIQHKLGDLVYVQHHYYVPPRGCTEGDYWLEGAGGFDCPACKHTTRLTSFDPRTEELSKLRRLFKTVRNVH